MTTPLKLLWLPLMLCALSSCAAQTVKSSLGPQIPIAATEARDACKVWKPVLFSRLHDSVDTIEQVKALNAAHDAFCGAGR